MKTSPLVALMSVALLASAACGSDSESGADAAGGDSAGGDTAITVAAGFYPLEYLVERVGGDRVDLSVLTPPGTEPHDLELTPDALATLQDADLVVYQAGFQPAVDDAIGGRDADSLDVSTVATRVLEEGEEHEGEEGEEHAEEEEHGGTDPHFWNDPTIYGQAAALVADALTEADPDGADTYAANLAELTSELTALDEDATAALGSCTIKTLVTAHDAFGYFTDRYGFESVSIAGISPDTEPSASELAEVTETVAAEGVTTIYTETLVSADIAETVAAETGAVTAVLDPLEGVTDESAGTDYPSIMRANIATAAAGQDCG